MRREWWHYPLLVVEVLAWITAIGAGSLFFMIRAAKVVVPLACMGLFGVVIAIWLIGTFFAALGF